MGLLGISELYREPLHRKYYASRLSCAYIFFLGCMVVLVLVPFFLAYTSGNFWLKESTYREQPRVQYMYKLIQVLEGTDADGMPMELFFSTVRKANDFRSPSVRVPLVQSREVDENDDGLTDRLELNLQTPLKTGETIYAASAFVFLEYRLRERARLLMESVGYVHYGSGMPGRALDFDGVLELKQAWPIQVVGGYRHLYADEPLLDPERLNARDLVPGVLMRKYTRRNVSTTLRGEAVWSRAAPTPLDSSTDRTIRPLFNLTATLHFPVTRVSYTPDVAEVLKNAWIQYLAMLVIVAFLVDRLLSFVLYHQVVETRMRVETAASQTGVKYHGL